MVEISGLGSPQPVYPSPSITPSDKRYLTEVIQLMDTFVMDNKANADAISIPEGGPPPVWPNETAKTVADNLANLEQSMDNPDGSYTPNLFNDPNLRKLVHQLVDGPYGSLGVLKSAARYIAEPYPASSPSPFAGPAPTDLNTQQMMVDIQAKIEGLRKYLQ